MDFGQARSPFKKRGSYVKMKQSPVGKSASLGDVLHTEEEEDGPLSYPQWGKAWQLYMETYLEEFPHERNAMLQYEFYIMDMMEKG